MRIGMEHILKIVAPGADSAYVKIGSKILREGLNDLQDAPSWMIEVYTEQLSVLLHWISSGDWTSKTIPMPEEFKK